MTLIPPPEVGWHEHVPSDVYHSWDAVSNSWLGKMDGGTPAHLKAYLENGSEQTKAMFLGTAIHAAVLERDFFKRAYAVMPDFGDCRNADNKRRKAEWVLDHANCLFLTEDEMRMCNGICDSVWAHPTASKILSVADAAELSGVWQDDETGLMCKLRMDISALALGIIGDLKSTEDASQRAFEKSIFNYGYHRQGAHYLIGGRELDRSYDSFVPICAEKKPPYAVAVYALKSDVIELASKRRRQLMEQYFKCKKSGVWESYPAGINWIGVPAWAERQIENQIYGGNE